MANALKVLIIGCGRMGASHAKAYQSIGDFKVAGLFNRHLARAEALNQELGGGIATFDDFARAMAATKPDVVCVCTTPGTHEEYAIAALKAGAHVFLEKPMATTVEGARRVVAAAKQARRKLVIGYGLRHHPSWIKFIEIARTMGKPLVMRMNLNQQVEADNWVVAKGLLESLSPIVDCGVHYVDVMCQMTGARPIRVSAIGTRLSDEIAKDMYNYGQLQVTFDDGSVGWYEAGWGPMISETAFFVKDVMGPKGCVSIVAASASAASKSGDIESHCKTESLKVHYADLGPDSRFTRPDEMVDLSDEPNHGEICRREQLYLLKTIREDLDLSQHMEDGINSLRIVLAADQSVRTGKTIELAG
ncbi:MAG: Gfo/Idh/MocA family oxidoreductase [bacterium]